MQRTEKVALSTDLINYMVDVKHQYKRAQDPKPDPEFYLTESTPGHEVSLSESSPISTICNIRIIPENIVIYSVSCVVRQISVRITWAAWRLGILFILFSWRMVSVFIFVVVGFISGILYLDFKIMLTSILSVHVVFPVLFQGFFILTSRSC